MKKLLVLLLLVSCLQVFSQKTEIRRGVTEIEISLMNSVDTFYIPNNYKVGAIMSLQIVYKDVQGTPNGSFNVYDTNDMDEEYIVTSTTQLPHTISSTYESIGLSKKDLAFTYIPVIFQKNGMTGGVIKLLLTIKQY